MSARSRGFTLVELIVLIAVLSIALLGVLVVFQNTVRASADPQARKQAIAVAEAMLDEILLTSFDVVNGVAAAPRQNYDDVRDYSGYATKTGIVDIQGNALPGLEQYNVAVNIQTVTLQDMAANEALRVTVTVTGPVPEIAVTLDGYRTRYVVP